MCESARWLRHGSARGFDMVELFSLLSTTMPTTRSKACQNAKEPYPAWECEAGDLPNEPTPIDPSPTPFIETEHSTTPTTPTPSSEPATTPEGTPRQVKNARNARWQPWQDRFLALEAIKHRPFLEARKNATQEAWDRMAEEMCRDSSQKGTVIDCTGSACRARFKLIIEAHMASTIYLLVSSLT
jgi:hypothetical protein